MTEARHFEGLAAPVATTTPKPQERSGPPAIDEAEQAHDDMMKALLAVMNEPGRHD
jgi:hypothetical protein